MTNCSQCRGKLSGIAWTRKTKRVLLYFCSLECNVENLEGNAKSPDPKKLAEQEAELAQARAQLQKEGGILDGIGFVNPGKRA